MNTLLIFVVLILVAIAVWQLTKIFELSQFNIKKDDSQIANDKDNDYNGKLMFAFLGFIYLFTIFLFGSGEKCFYHVLHQNTELK